MCSWIMSTLTVQPKLMKHFTLILSMLVASAAIAQKPLDRGIHKRTTGGVSFLFGKKKAKQTRNAEVLVLEEAHTPDALAPIAIPMECEPAGLLMVPSHAMSDKVVASLPQKAFSRRSRFMRPLRRKAMGPFLTLAPERRLLHRVHPMGDVPADEKAPFDLMTIIGLTGVVLCPIFFPLIVPGILFSIVGITRTKDGIRRGRKMAVTALVCALLGIAFWGIVASLSISYLNLAF